MFTYAGKCENVSSLLPPGPLANRRAFHHANPLRNVLSRSEDDFLASQTGKLPRMLRSDSLCRSITSRRQRQPHREDRALAGLALGLHAAFHGLRQVFDDRQAKSGAAQFP